MDIIKAKDYLLANNHHKSALTGELGRPGEVKCLRSEKLKYNNKIELHLEGEVSIV